MSDETVTILVVDDDEFTAELTGMILESAGFEIVVAVGGLEAIEKMEQTPAIKMVVSDMNMPFMDGVELHSELRKLGFSQPFVLLTGEAAAPLRIAHPQIDAVVTKDEDLQDTLPTTVATLLGNG
jgi:CheY-like chemotaxis protein